MSRKDEILNAVDTLIQVHDEWETDPQSPDVPTMAFEHAVEDCIEICRHGDTPEVCRELTAAVARFAVDWQDYKDGHRTPDQRPAGRFWASFRAMLNAREGAQPFIPKPPEPVAELLRQNVSHRQIALYIYGDGKSGPFVDAAGQPNIALIHKEAAAPGSVIPEDWIHPQQVQLHRAHNASVKARLQAVESRENDGDQIDPATIEELLRQGQYPSVVARVKRVSLDEVMAVVRKLHTEGVAVNETPPNLAAMRAPTEPQLSPEDDAALQPAAAKEPKSPTSPKGKGKAAKSKGKGTAKPTEQSDPDAQIDIEDGDDEDDVGDVDATLDSQTTDDIDSVILLLHQDNPDMGAGELVTAVREHLGDDVTVNVRQVNAVLKKARELETASVGA